MKLVAKALKRKKLSKFELFFCLFILIVNFAYLTNGINFTYLFYCTVLQKKVNIKNKWKKRISVDSKITLITSKLFQKYCLLSNLKTSFYF